MACQTATKTKSTQTLFFPKWKHFIDVTFWRGSENPRNFGEIRKNELDFRQCMLGVILFVYVSYGWEYGQPREGKRFYNR